MRTPVDDSFASIYKSFFIVFNENFLNSLGTAFIHSKTLSLPVTGRTKFFQLFNNASAVLLSPVPCTFKKFFSSQIVFSKTFFSHCLNNFCFCCNGSMVSSGNPQCTITRHSFPTNKNILQGIVQRMPHMELACDIRGRNNDSIRFLLRIPFSMKAVIVGPVFIDFVLNF